MHKQFLKEEKGYVIYCRKSSESEERQVLSIESQLKELKETANRLNLNVVEILTESKSAKEPGRPVFNELIESVKKNKFKGILCWKIDRLARNPIDGASLVYSLDQGTLKEIITPQGRFQNYSNDKFMMQIEFGMAKKYVDDLSDNVKRGNRAKLEQGWIPGLPPLGYLNDPKEKITVKDPERFQLVQNMWKMLIAGYSVSQILRTANDKWGFRTRVMGKLGGKPLGLSIIYRLFRNPFYYGLIERKGEVYQGKHARMITESEFWKVQELLGSRGRARPKKNIYTFAYTGFMKCAECGCSITAERKVNRYKKEYVYYHCTKRKRNFLCPQQYVNVKDLEKQILENYIEKFWINDVLYDIIINYLDREKFNDHQSEAAKEKSHQYTLNKCIKKLKNLNRMRLEDLLGDEEYIYEKRKLLNEKIRLESKIQTEKDPNKESSNFDEFISFAHKVRYKFLNGDSQTKREILLKIGSNFLIRDKTLLIQLKKPLLALGRKVEYFNEIDWFELLKNGSFTYHYEQNHPIILSLYSWIRDIRNSLKGG